MVCLVAKVGCGAGICKGGGGFFLLHGGVEGGEEGDGLVVEVVGEVVFEYFCGDVVGVGVPWAGLALLAEVVTAAVLAIEEGEVAAVAGAVSVACAAVYVDAVLEELEGDLGGGLGGVDGLGVEGGAEGACMVDGEEVNAVTPDFDHLAGPEGEIGVHF